MSSYSDIIFNMMMVALWKKKKAISGFVLVDLLLQTLILYVNVITAFVLYFTDSSHHIITPQHSSPKGRSPSTSSMILPQMVIMVVWTKVVVFRSSVLPTAVLAALLCGAPAAFLLLEERAEHSNRP